MRNFEKDWLAVKGGYFGLLSNLETTPAELLGIEVPSMARIGQFKRETLGIADK